MKKLAFVFTVFAAIALVNGPAMGASEWDPMGAVYKLRQQVKELTDKVSSLEMQLRLSNQHGAQDTLAAVVVKGGGGEPQPPVQVKKQSEIVRVSQRGMFMPISQ